MTTRATTRFLATALTLATGCTAIRTQPADEHAEFPGLGGFHRPVTTSSPEAQRLVDQGLAFLYAFNHDEARRAFRRATEADPGCAMAWVGIATANGPHINYPMVPEAHAKEAWQAVQAARANVANGTPVERALVDAVATRWSATVPKDRKALDVAYAEAMRAVWRSHPDDPDVGTLFAESLMDLRPWDLWTPDGTAQPGTDEVLATLEAVLATHPRHPHALHLYIHAVEVSPHPEKADRAADTLRDLQPGLGHLVHMPSHIDVRRGRWHEAIVANAKAIDADRRYRERTPTPQGFYRVYMAHNQHMLTYAAMMTGQSALAIRTIDAMTSGIPPEWARENAPFADGYMAMPLDVRLRFGRWDEVIAAPEPPPYFPIARAMRRSARAIAYAAKGKLREARAEARRFAAARRHVPNDVPFGNNGAADLLGVAERMMTGEILVRAGAHDRGLAALRQAVAREDSLRYNEPPDWILPVRHALGAALVRANRLDEAEAVFRADLAKLPGNGWSLFGLAQVLERTGRTAEAAHTKIAFDSVWRDGDITLTSACYCQADAS